jgi:hypothetical protein
MLAGEIAVHQIGEDAAAGGVEHFVRDLLARGKD